MTINSQAKGKKTERDVAGYFTRNGLPLRREVRTGDRNHPDEGDLRCPGITIEVKNWSGDLTIGSVITLLGKLEWEQRRDGDLGLLVDRLDRVADPGKWRCWMTTCAARALLIRGSKHGMLWHEELDFRIPRDSIEPVAFRLAWVVTRLVAGGWADPIDPFA